MHGAGFFREECYADLWGNGIEPLNEIIQFATSSKENLIKYLDFASKQSFSAMNPLAPLEKRTKKYTPAVRHIRSLIFRHWLSTEELAKEFTEVHSKHAGELYKAFDEGTIGVIKLEKLILQPCAQGTYARYIQQLQKKHAPSYKGFTADFVVSPDFIIAVNALEKSKNFYLNMRRDLFQKAGLNQRELASSLSFSAVDHHGIQALSFYQTLALRLSSVLNKTSQAWSCSLFELFLRGNRDSAVVVRFGILNELKERIPHELKEYPQAIQLTKVGYLVYDGLPLAAWRYLHGQPYQIEAIPWQTLANMVKNFYSRQGQLIPFLAYYEEKVRPALPNTVTALRSKGTRKDIIRSFAEKFPDEYLSAVNKSLIEPEIQEEIEKSKIPTQIENETTNLGEGAKEENNESPLLEEGSTATKIIETVGGQEAAPTLGEEDQKKPVPKKKRRKPRRRKKPEPTITPPKPTEIPTAAGPEIATPAEDIPLPKELSPPPDNVPEKERSNSLITNDDFGGENKNLKIENFLPKSEDSNPPGTSDKYAYLYKLLVNTPMYNPYWSSYFKKFFKFFGVNDEQIAEFLANHQDCITLHDADVELTERYNTLIQNGKQLFQGLHDGLRVHPRMFQDQLNEFTYCQATMQSYTMPQRLPFIKIPCIELCLFQTEVSRQLEDQELQDREYKGPQLEGHQSIDEITLWRYRRNKQEIPEKFEYLKSWILSQKCDFLRRGQFLKSHIASLESCVGFLSELHSYYYHAHLNFSRSGNQAQHQSAQGAGQAQTDQSRRY